LTTSGNLTQTVSLDICDQETTIIVCNAETCTRDNSDILSTQIGNLGDCVVNSSSATTISQQTISTKNTLLDQSTAQIDTPNWIPYAAALLAGILGLFI